MLILLYLTVLVAAMYWVARTLLPEMLKAPPAKRSAAQDDFPQLSASSASEKKAERLEMLLVEKNSTINLLQAELKSFQIQVRSFDKLKTLLEEEIHRLREQNRIFRSELGMPTVESKEESIS